MANFKTIETKGYTKQEALVNAPFQVIRAPTQLFFSRPSTYYGKSPTNLL